MRRNISEATESVVRVLDLLDPDTDRNECVGRGHVVPPGFPCCAACIGVAFGEAQSARGALEVGEASIHEAMRELAQAVGQ